MVKFSKAIFLTLLFIVGITFADQNREPLVLHYYFGLETPPVPIFLLVLFSVLLGVLLAGIGFIIDQWTLKKVVRQKGREIESLEREIREIQEK
jgi:uncharacterized integral membrane protein